MTNFDVPILFIVFNRPTHAGLVFDEISKLKPSTLYIACDGPRPDYSTDYLNVELTKKIFLNIDWDCNLKTMFRKDNIGCKLAVKGALDWFFEHEEHGIILEDDCLPSQSFFYFCKELLNRYSMDNRVMHINGFNQYGLVDENQSYGFTVNNFVWGWATWRRSWNLHDDLMGDLDEFIYKKYFLNISANKSLMKRWHSGLIKNLSPTFKSWVAPWQYSIWKNGGLGIFPTKNLVRNIGFDSMASGNKDSDHYWAQVPKYEINFPLSHPKLFMRHPAYDFRSLNIFKKFICKFNSLARKFNNFLRSINES